MERVPFFFSECYLGTPRRDIAINQIPKSERTEPAIVSDILRHVCRRAWKETRLPKLSPSFARLSVAPEGQGVVAEPGLPATGTGLVVAVALVETAGLLAGGGEATGLAVLVDRVDDPVDARILADGLVGGVDEDDLVVLVGGVLVDPVRVEDAEVSAAAADTLLSGGLEGSLVLQLVHTLVGGLACSRTIH